MKDFSFNANFLSMLIECLSFMYFFKKLEKRNDGLQRHFTFLFLIPLVIIYLPIIAELNSTDVYSLDNLINQLLRTLFNLVGVFVYVYCSKEIKPQLAAYLSSFYILSYMVAFNIRENFRHLLMELCPQCFETAMVLALGLALFLVVFVVDKLLRINEIDSATPRRWTVVIIAMLIELYFKWSLVAPDPDSIRRLGDAVFYSFCATLGVFALVVLFEMNADIQQRNNSIELEKMQMQYEMQNAKRTLLANSDIKRIYHDMKNHIIALQSMEGGEEIKKYLSALSEEFEGYECNVKTGNSVVDSLVSEKMQLTRLHDISFNVCVDLTPLNYMHTVDIVTIFGNAIDNAIEAVCELEDKNERIIYIKSAEYANMILLRFSNKYVGKPNIENGILKTSKSDSEFHGIGLNSIKKAAKRYDGTIETQIDKEVDFFRLVVMIPIPE